MKIHIQAGFKDRLRGRFGKYEFEVGILQDKPHYWPSYGPTSKLAKESPPRTGLYAGGPVRKIFRGSYKGRPYSNDSIADVSRQNRDRLGFNYLAKPFENKSTDIMKFTKEFFRLAFGKSEKKRCENLLQAIVRNPILKGDYGPQSERSFKTKGFNRPMIDTAQLFKAIKARANVRLR